MHDIGAKIHDEIRPFEEVCKKMIEEFSSSIDNTEEKHLPQAGMITDMIKDLCEAKEKIVKACYYKYILCAMQKEDEEEKEDEKRLLKMLKEEHEDEYKRMREEYGEEEADRRFYDNWRHSDGRFARKGTGSYRPRSSGRKRGYEEPPYLHMPLDYRMDMEDYTAYPPEYWRDMDRGMGKMYYTDGGSGGSYGGNSVGNSGQSGNMGGSGMIGGNSGGSRGYSDGYDEGSRRGYEDGYRDGERSGRNSGGRRDGREGRSGQSRRSYMETKETNKGNSPQEKQEKMKELEKYVGELGSDIAEMISDASPEERALLKQKMQVLVQKLG